MSSTTLLLLISYLLALELRLCRQVVSIIVAEMVVRRDREGFDGGEDRLELRLARLEVIFSARTMKPGTKVF